METPLPRLDEDEALHLDLIGSGSEDEVVASLKYYAVGGHDYHMPTLSH